MPYIKEERRAFYFNNLIGELVDKCQCKGDVTYVISRIVHQWVLSLGKKCYVYLSEGKSIIEDTLDSYRGTVYLPYENKKRMENGPVSDLDSKSLEDVR